MQAAGVPTKLSAHNSATGRSRQREGQRQQERNQARERGKGKDQTQMKRRMLMLFDPLIIFNSYLLALRRMNNFGWLIQFGLIFPYCLTAKEAP